MAINEDQKHLLKEIKELVNDTQRRIDKIVQLLSVLVDENTEEKIAKKKFLYALEHDNKAGYGGTGGSGGAGGTGSPGQPGEAGTPPTPAGEGGRGGMGGKGGDAGSGGGEGGGSTGDNS